MGTGKAARVRRVAYQRKFKREQHDNKAINAMIERAEKIADGRALLKKARFLKVTGATTELDQITIDRARQLVGLKGHVTNLPRLDDGRRRDYRGLPRPLGATRGRMVRAELAEGGPADAGYVVPGPVRRDCSRPGVRRG